MRKGELIKENEVLKRKIQMLEDTNRILLNKNEFSHIIHIFLEGYYMAEDAGIVNDPNEYAKYLNNLLDFSNSLVREDLERRYNKN